MPAKNIKSVHQRITIGYWLTQSIDKLAINGIRNPRLDCLVMMEDVTKKNKSHLLANLNTELTKDQQVQLGKMLDRRFNREPLAYIRGFKEFYGINFQVNPDVLIPRPETEDIIDIIENIKLAPDATILDVGTGSGNIAITIASRNKLLRVSATDISSKALQTAKINAKLNNAKIDFIQSDLLKNVDGQFDVIVANLPYVSKRIPTEPELKLEPSTAIFAEQDGLDLILKLIDQIYAKNILANSGWLIIESHSHQHQEIADYCSRFGLKLRQTTNLIQAFQLTM
ncbi:peptide chain release factor N(5)-glutamine methyltransferase [Candidatus Saccharibacteria bacterium]|nr:peptide chain release factor N(5)-glutamine methyltransferase [Candidatus Saccharibacteria bacterium]